MNCANALTRGGDLLFPTDVTEGEWLEFAAAGFAKPVCGFIRRRVNAVTYGVPLGGIDTGSLAIGSDSSFGLCSIFNSFVPMRGPLKLPFLGISVGKMSWVLSTAPFESNQSVYLKNLASPSDIHYWGHFPVADLEYETPGMPVSVGMRAWTPFILGDSAVSNTPAAIFEVHLRNLSGTAQEGCLAFSFPGPTQEEAQITHGSPRKRVKAETAFNKRIHTWVPVADKVVRSRQITSEGDFTGIYITSELDNKVGYALGVIGKETVRIGRGLGFDFSAWAAIGTALPRVYDITSFDDPNAETDFSRSVAVGYSLKPGEVKVVRFVLAWFAPVWIGEGDHDFSHMYSTRFTDALAVAQFTARNHESLLRRVLAWQQTLYAETQLPVWLREALVNSLHPLATCSFWAVAKPPIGDWCRKEDGLFGLVSGIIDWPNMEVIIDIWYSNWPVVLFFPDLAMSEIRGHKAYMFANGTAAWLWGGYSGEAKGGYLQTAGTEMTIPSPGFQTTTNGSCYVDMVDRVLMRTGNDDMLREFYPSIKKNTIYTMGLRPEDGDDGIISAPSGNVDPYNPQREPGLWLEMFEMVKQYGMVTHIGGIHLAQLVMAERMAKKMDDKEFARQCRAWLEAGSRSLEEKMWTGSYYLLYNEPKTGKRSDLVFGYQLDGDWMAKVHGFPGVFRPDRAKTTLETIKRLNGAITSFGIVDVVTPEGHLAAGVGSGMVSFFPMEAYIIGATYMYEGQREFGLEMVRRCQVALNQTWGYTWDQPNMIRADTGQKGWGTLTTLNMDLWVVPAALMGKDLSGFCAAGGLVDRMIQAANKAT